MGEAAIKEKRRREHATKIVAAFEYLIECIIGDAEFNDSKSYFQRADAREKLIDILVTPPPK